MNALFADHAVISTSLSIPGKLMLKEEGGTLESHKFASFVNIHAANPWATFIHTHIYKHTHLYLYTHIRTHIYAYIYNTHTQKMAMHQCTVRHAGQPSTPTRGLLGRATKHFDRACIPSIMEFKVSCPTKIEVSLPCIRNFESTIHLVKASWKLGILFPSRDVSCYSYFNGPWG